MGCSRFLAALGKKQRDCYFLPAWYNTPVFPGTVFHQKRQPAQGGHILITPRGYPGQNASYLQWENDSRRNEK